MLCNTDIKKKKKTKQTNKNTKYENKKLGNYYKYICIFFPTLTYWYLVYIYPNYTHIYRRYIKGYSS